LQDKDEKTAAMMYGVVIELIRSYPKEEVEEKNYTVVEVIKEVEYHPDKDLLVKMKNIDNLGRIEITFSKPLIPFLDSILKEEESL